MAIRDKAILVAGPSCRSVFGTAVVNSVKALGAEVVDGARTTSAGRKVLQLACTIARSQSVSGSRRLRLLLAADRRQSRSHRWFAFLIYGGQPSAKASQELLRTDNAHVVYTLGQLLGLAMMRCPPISATTYDAITSTDVAREALLLAHDLKDEPLNLRLRETAWRLLTERQKIATGETLEMVTADGLCARLMAVAREVDR